MIALDPAMGVVLDLDDTLYAERDYQDSGFRAVARAVSADGWFAVYEQMQRSGDPLGEAARHSGREVSELLQIHRTHDPDIALYPDAQRLLDRLPSPPALITDGRSLTQRNKIRALGLEPRLAAVIISEEFGVGKPDPRVFQAAAEALGTDRLCYIADNPAKDFVTPRAMGWTTIMVRDRGRNVHSQDAVVAAEYRAGLVVDSLDELVFGQ